MRTALTVGFLTIAAFAALLIGLALQPTARYAGAFFVSVYGLCGYGLGLLNSRRK